CEPAGDPEVSGLLLRAAAGAAPAEAVAYLDRALAEGAAGDDRAPICARLAVAAFDGELPDARRRLYEGLGGGRDAELLTCLAGLQALTGGDDGLADRLDADAAGDPACAVAALDVLERPRRRPRPAAPPAPPPHAPGPP